MIYNSIKNFNISQNICPNCSQKVWSLQFEDKNIELEYFGAPFIDHLCNKPDYLKEFIWITQNVHQITDIELENIANDIIKNYLPNNLIKKIIQYELSKRTLNFSFTEFNCSQDIKFIFGEVIFAYNNVDLYSEFNIDKESLLGKALLGKYSDIYFDKYIIRDNPDLHNHSNQFTIFALKNTLQNNITYKKIFSEVDYIELPQNNFWLIKNITIFD